jgi:hypothetical protein
LPEVGFKTRGEKNATRYNLPRIPMCSSENFAVKATSNRDYPYHGVRSRISAYRESRLSPRRCIQSQSRRINRRVGSRGGHKGCPAPLKRRSQPESPPSSRNPSKLFLWEQYRLRIRPHQSMLPRYATTKNQTSFRCGYCQTTPGGQRMETSSPR